jgi:uncharacterized tellurite resistance protein B-like protein
MKFVILDQFTSDLKHLSPDARERINLAVHEIAKADAFHKITATRKQLQ